MRSDSNTTIIELRNKVREFVHARNWGKYHNPKDLAISICIEAAELLELFQWRSVDEVLKWIDDEEKRKKVTEELADVLIYGLSMANILNIDLTSAILDKLTKNESKYPFEKYKGKAHLD